MKQIDLGQSITILASLGVIAGIVFLGLELRQNNELMEAEARFNRLSLSREASNIQFIKRRGSFSEEFVRSAISVALKSGRQRSGNEEDRLWPAGRHTRESGSNRGDCVSWLRTSSDENYTARFIASFIAAVVPRLARSQHRTSGFRVRF
jgi:hypothetical protein